MIVSASAAMTAPAANASGSDTISGSLPESGPAPMTTAKASSTPHAIQSPMTCRMERPCSRIDADPTSASGRLETKMAASSATPPVPSVSEMPRARFSGAPSRVAAASSARPAEPRTDAAVGGRSAAAASVSSFALPRYSSAGFSLDFGCAHRSSRALSPVNTAAPTKRPMPARQMPPRS